MTQELETRAKLEEVLKALEAQYDLEAINIVRKMIADIDNQVDTFEKEMCDEQDR